MKLQPTLTLLMGALALCLGTLAFTRSSEAQGIKELSQNAMKTKAINSEVQKSAKASAGEEDIQLMVVDDKYLWVAQGSNVTRIDRETLAATPVSLKAAPAAAGVVPVDRSDLSRLSGIKGILKPPGR